MEPQEIKNDEKLIKDVEIMLQYIIDTQPSYIQTPNPYVRLTVYKALDEYVKDHDKVWIMRKNEKQVQYAKYTMCYRHKCNLTGACDCCSDPFCGGPYCEECDDSIYARWANKRGDDYYCPYAVEKGDEMYKSKVTVGLYIYYKESDKPYKKLKQFPRPKI